MEQKTEEGVGFATRGDGYKSSLKCKMSDMGTF